MKKIFALILAAALLLSLSACGQTAAAPTAAATEAPVVTEAAPETTAAPETQAAPAAPVNVMVLNGTTGFGMASLMDAAANGQAAQDYSFSVETDASNIVAALANGSVDIAALPTNAAATVYNKTQGKVQVLALNTLGVLYLVTDGSVNVESIEDLAGQTVYAPAQNPSFIFQHIVTAAGVDVTIDNTYAQPADLNTAVASGQVSIAVLPEPMVTVAKSKNPELQVALDLTAEWDKVAPAGSLVQGCVVVRKAFAEENAAAVETFLAEYGASIEALTTDIEGTAAKIEATGIFTKAAVAAKAIPNCNVCFITGEAMQAALSEFLTIMHGVAPASVGGSIPGDDFYCILN